MAGMTISEVQDAVKEWINGTDKGYFPPLSMLAASMEELGEVGREIKPPGRTQNKERGKEGRKTSGGAVRPTLLRNLYGKLLRHRPGGRAEGGYGEVRRQR